MATILPINQTPILNCRMHYAFMLAIITTMDNHEPWLFSNFINLQCNKAETISDLNNELRFCKSDSPIYYSAMIDLEVMKAPTFNKLNCSILNVVRNAIADKKYVYMFANKFHIPMSPFYQEVSVTQDLLVYGVDEEKGIYYILCYNKNKQFTTIEVSFADMELAVQHSEYAFWNNTMYFIQCPDASFEFRVRVTEVDMDLLLQELIDYKESTCRSEVVKQNLNTDYYDFGISIYEMIKGYIAYMHANYEHFDPLIALTTLWEHKKLMHARVRYLKEKQLIDAPSRLVEEFEQLESKAAALRNIAIKMKLLNRLDLEKLYALVDEIRELEVKALSELIKRIEEKQPLAIAATS
ncbi:hypothetical protein [Paenibacillus sp. MMS18-CY102]|uniref:hypothetical protein n=1 Tax=Paenibacillus sp. MMS18-CY102 TaxID=2682849 RepID=UPI0013662391|nr:hypothetical protein [Paenibacillus sp. MMS18-CY102]MWC31171.1 hypothetical protein [Paenibacillus sp. MMS18-CY102]